MLTFAAGFVIKTVSPGKNAADFTYKPGGNSPCAATTALPSSEGLDAETKSNKNKIEAAIFAIIFFIIINLSACRPQRFFNG